MTSFDQPFCLCHPWFYYLKKKKDEINDGNQYKIKLECLLNVWADFCQALPWQRSKGWTHLTYRNSLQIWMKSCWKFQRLTVNRPFKTFKNPYGCGIPRPPCHLVRSRVKMRCVDLLLQLLWPSGSRLTARTDKEFRCTCTGTACAASTGLHKNGFVHSFKEKPGTLFYSYSA